MNIHKSNVTGCNQTVQKYIHNETFEEFRNIENKFILERLKENDNYESKFLMENCRNIERNKQLDLEFEDYKGRNKRDLIFTKERVKLDNIKGKEEINKKSRKIYNQKQKDNETLEKQYGRNKT